MLVGSIYFAAFSSIYRIELTHGPSIYIGHPSKCQVVCTRVAHPPRPLPPTSTTIDISVILGHQKPITNPDPLRVTLSLHQSDISRPSVFCSKRNISGLIIVSDQHQILQSKLAKDLSDEKKIARKFTALPRFLCGHDFSTFGRVRVSFSKL